MAIVEDNLTHTCEQAPKPSSGRAPRRGSGRGDGAARPGATSTGRRATPSTGRWSTESVTVITAAGTTAPSSTTGSLRTAPTARIAAWGGLMIARELLDAEHPEVGDGDRAALELVLLQPALPGPLGELADAWRRRSSPSAARRRGRTGVSRPRSVATATATSTAGERRTASSVQVDVHLRHLRVRRAPPP